jgi:hypothetical protein
MHEHIHEETHGTPQRGMGGRIRLELRDRGSRIVEVREAENAVMQAGATLIAQLFSGSGSAITHMGVGTSDAPESDAFATAALTGDGLAGDTEAAIPADAFVAPFVDEVHRVVRVKVRTTLPPLAAVGTVREAGLLSHGDGDPVLYNRVTFSPIEKGDDHELTMFWEVTFPYGDLQTLL